MPWQQMSILRLLTTIATTAALVAVLVHITTSAETGLSYLFGLVYAWLVFAAVMSLGAVASILVVFVAEMLMLFVQNDGIKEHVYLGLRWTAFLAGMSALLWIGGRGVYDGLQNNRLVDPRVLYEQCMKPRTRAVQDHWQECSDGWGSSSIGRRGACSHHGGVVWRMVERKEHYQPHSATYCRADASARSWLD